MVPAARRPCKPQMRQMPGDADFVLVKDPGGAYTTPLSEQMTQGPYQEDPTEGAANVAVRIRLKRLGRTHRAHWRICATDKRAARDGRVIEELGHYDPLQKDEDKVTIDRERVVHWLSAGAWPSKTVTELLAHLGLDAKGNEIPPRPWKKRKKKGPPPKAAERVAAEKVRAEEEAAPEPAEEAALAPEEAAPEPAEEAAPAPEEAKPEPEAEAPAEEAAPEPPADDEKPADEAESAAAAQDDQDKPAEEGATE